mmetsp:Transcript_44476/g.96764  ORF Transcript_44476/g.96764 Transcript_44476/m.96764 type:complete len:257 (-) Transcript_44476:116-886(-)|eukprot:CAMPEP_0170626542 /NCGR_PEP_ID=MMETSP0224-20130122/31416_1 /TAXON_ID=285029 /ORGANISM="Togula jolla, Strain CCCM 725" /LENGTH=256 /DNA_ID=CAMNT_0010953327 /DNA_START=67 /DNA_END=837 /DNA_ORIENTATION=-
MASASAAKAARLWQWAGPKVPTIHYQAHLETCAFVDSLYSASWLLQGFLPVANVLANINHRLRGTKGAPELESMTMLENWNKSDSFLEGAEQAHVSLLRCFWRPQAEVVPMQLREGIGPEVVDWLNGDVAERGWEEELVDVVAASRFERLYGPPSLEMLKKVTVSTMRSAELVEAFREDMWRGSQLNLQLGSVVQARRRLGGEGADSKQDLVLRRLDRLTLACDFNLREGIASQFRVTGIANLGTEVRTGGFTDEE